MMLGPTRPFVLLTAVLVLPCSAVAAQDSMDPFAELSADTVDVAEVFELRVRVPVPAGSAVFFPDTLAATPDLESFAPAAWEADRAPGGGAVLTLVYPLIPFGSGGVSVPSFTIVVGPAQLAAEGAGLPGGSRVGSWDDAPRASTAAIRRISSPDLSVRVRPVQSDADIIAGASPRGPDDVLGPSWSWPTVGLLALFSSTLVGAGVSATRASLARRTRAPAAAPGAPPTSEAVRLAALAELDHLLASGPHTGDRIPVVYETSSGIVRGYVELLDSAWGPELTSTELMERLRAGAGVSERFVDAMRVAERVKFGRLRPGSADTESYLRTLRDWLYDGRAAA
jgi:hypothetical protein